MLACKRSARERPFLYLITHKSHKKYSQSHIERWVSMSELLFEGFNKKFIFCGDYLITKEYSLPYLNGITKHDNIFHSFDTSSGKAKRQDNLKRTRDTVAQIVYANLTPHTKFLTLTSSKTILDVKTFDRMKTTFCQAMKRQGFPLQYLYVYERQKERGKKEKNIGCLHIHMIIFNDEKIPMNILKKCWPHGRVELKILDGLRVKDDKVSQELIKNPASYVCKYITKESVAEWNEKVFRCSKNLKKPIVCNNKVHVNGDCGAIEEDSENFYSCMQQAYPAFYSTAKVCRVPSNGGVKERFLSITVGKRKED